MKVITTILLLIAGTALAVPSFGQAGDPQLGKAVYTKSCATCHGAAGEGKAAIAKLMKVELRHLGSKEVQAQNDVELGKIILAGKGKMKPPRDVKQADLPNLLAYFRTLAQK